MIRPPITQEVCAFINHFNLQNGAGVQSREAAELLPWLGLSEKQAEEAPIVVIEDVDETYRQKALRILRKENHLPANTSSMP